MAFVFKKHELSFNLATLMRSRDLNGKQLSEVTGVPASTISRILNEKIANPRASVLKPIADFFGVGLEDLASPDVLLKAGERKQSLDEWIPLVDNDSVFMDKIMSDAVEVDAEDRWKRLEGWLPPCPDASVVESLKGSDDADTIEVFGIRALDNGLAPNIRKGDILYAMRTAVFPTDRIFVALVSLNSALRFYPREVTFSADKWYCRSTSPEIPGAGVWNQIDERFDIAAVVVGLYRSLKTS